MKNLNIFSLITEYDNAKSGGVLDVPNVSFINESGGIKCLPKLEDPYNGYEYVDLGLPSGLKWATCNIGASSPEQAGLYFAWGETTGYTTKQVTSGVRKFDDTTYQAGAAASISADLTLEQDAVRTNLGGNWRMPTEAEYQELLVNCTSTWTTNYNGTGVKGCILTSKVNGNSVFFPAAGNYNKWGNKEVGSHGYYWSASWDTAEWATNLYFKSGNIFATTGIRYYGQPVRGVFK